MQILLTTLLLWAALFSSSPISAQEPNAVLRAGEHIDFTRLVLSLRDQTAWRLVPSAGYVDLVLDDPAIFIDVSQTFDRIPRSRLRDVANMATGVRLYLACECPLRVVDGFPNQIIVDIVSPKFAAASELSALRPKPRPNTDDTPLGVEATRYENALALRAGTALARSIRDDGIPLPATTESRVWPELANPGVEKDTQTEPSAPAPEENAKELLDRLMYTLSSAVSRGTLSPRDLSSDNVGMDALVQSTAGAHLRSVDASHSATDFSATAMCDNAVSAQITDWASPADLEMQGLAWAKLYDPLDRIDPAEVIQLSATLLRAGFGAETRALLSLLPIQETPEQLLALSRIMDSETGEEEYRLADYASCSDTDMLWAFLTQPEEIVTLPRAEDRIIRAVQSLSQSLRAQLGPRTVQNLIRVNANEAAALVQAVLERTDMTNIAATPELLQADRDAIDNATRTDWQMLGDEELLLMLSNANMQELPLPAQALDQAVSRQYARRRSESGRAFAIESARALAHTGAFPQAFDLATSSEADLSADDLATLLAQLFKLMAEHADDTTFVTTTFAHKPLAENLEAEELRRTVAARLGLLGFEGAANEILRKTGTANRVTENAQTSIVTQSPAAPGVAPRRPATNTGPETMINTADTASAQTDTGRSIVRDGPELDQFAPRTTETAPGETPMEPIAEPAPQNAGPLAQGRSELQQSAELRARLSALLDEAD